MANAPAQPAGLLPAVQSLLYIVITGLFLMTFTVQPIRIPTDSMEPTLLVGDFLLLDKQSVAGNGRGRLFPPTGISRGDIVVFHNPVDDPSIHIVKRVIALPGDRLHLHDGAVFLNGHPIREPYAVYRRANADAFRDNFPTLQTLDARINPAWWIRLRTLVHNGDITVPPGSYFVMGDNRNDSDDSRFWGFVPRDAIVGKPLLIYFSWNQPSADDEDGIIPLRTANPPTRPAEFARWNRAFQVVH